MFLGLTIEHIPADVRSLAEKCANITTILKSELQSAVVTDVAALFPGGEQLDTDCIAACNVAVTACKAVENIADSPAVNAILQRLGADLTKIQHSSEKHTISFYIASFEIVFHDIFGKSAA